MDLVIKSAKIATETGVFVGDIGVKDGKIAAISQFGSLSGKKEIDASGLIAMPGVIDAHTHFELPIMNSSTADDFESGSKACAAGGVTTFIDFVTQEKGHTLYQDLADRMAQADPKVYVDYSLHIGITDFNKESFEAIPKIIKMGIPSFKIYMSYADEGWMASEGDLVEVMELTRDNGGIMGVHAENQSIIDKYTKELVAQGKLSYENHAKSRPHYSEVEALRRVLYLAELTASPLHIFHLTTGEGARLVAESRGKGVAVSAETCPHYLILDESIYKGEKGWLYPSCPPVRFRSDSEVLWKALSIGSVQSIATDHCSFTVEQKEQFKDDFRKIPRGLPGCETLLPMIYTRGVKKGRISLEKMVSALSANPARIFGLYPQKGSFNIGADADIAIFDPNTEYIMSPELMHMKAGYTPYDGKRTYGITKYTISRGEVIYDNGRFTAEAGRGRFVKRFRSPEFF
ncbi:MAG: dihydropyrimidinase [bacterium]|nr:dihydropyrimidinase [bacterium]